MSPDRRPLAGPFCTKHSFRPLLEELERRDCPSASLSGPGDQNNLAGTSVYTGVSGWSSDGGSFTYSESGMPPGLNFDRTTGIFSGTILDNAASSTPYVVTVSEASSGGGAEITFNWTVNPPEVSVSGPGDQTNLAGSSVYTGVSGWDSDGYPLTYSASGLPSWLRIDPTTGIISGTIPDNAARDAPWAVTASATDTSSGVGANVSFDFTVNPPEVSVSGPGDQTNLAGSSVYTGVSGWDSDGYPLTYSAAGLPSWLSIDPTTGIISGTIPDNAARDTPWAVTASATDTSSGVGASVSLDFTVTPPEVSVSGPGDQTNLAGSSVYTGVSGWDSDGYPLTYSAAGLPIGVNLDPSTGIISGTIPDGAGRDTPWVVNLTATDTSSGVSASTSFSLTVTPPEVSIWGPGDLTYLAGSSVYTSVSGSVTDGYPLTYSASGLPSWLSLDPATGIISGTIPDDAARNTPWMVNLTATDTSSGVSATVRFDLTVTPPEISVSGPGDQTNLAGSSVYTGVSGWDSDGYPLTYSASGLPSWLSIDRTTGILSGTIPDNAARNTPWAVTATATDTSSGTSANVRFDFTVNPPEASVSGPGDQTNLAGSSVYTGVSGWDSDAYPLTYSATGLPAGLNIDPNTGIISGTIPDNAARDTPWVAR